MIGTFLRTIAVITIVFLAALPATAQLEFIDESFEPEAGWNWGLPTQLVSDGGSPGAYLESVGILDTFLPKLATGVGVDSKFVGDYRAARVRGVGVTIQIGSVQTPEGRDLSVELANDGGTPDDVDDDCSAYLVGNENIPLPGEGWKRYVFLIPSRSETLPAGWSLLSVEGNSCPGMTDDEAWNHVITNVSELRFSYGDPSFFYIFQQWEGLAADNPTIARSQ